MNSYKPFQEVFFLKEICNKTRTDVEHVSKFDCSLAFELFVVNRRQILTFGVDESDRHMCTTDFVYR